MKKFIKAIVFIFILVIMPVLADYISNNITMEMIMKVLGIAFVLSIAYLIKEGN